MRKTIMINLINFMMIMFLEGMFAWISFDTYSMEEVCSIVIYSLFTSFIMTVLMTSFNEKVNRIVSYIVYFVFCLWFTLECVFKSFLHTFFSISLFKLTDQAASFMDETMRVVITHLPYIILFFIPFILLIVMRKRVYFKINFNKKYLLVYLFLIPLTFFGYRLFIDSTKNREEISLYDLYYNVDNMPLSIQRMGVLSSTGLDIYRNIFGFDDKVIMTYYEDSSDIDDGTISSVNTLELDLSDPLLNDDIKKQIENNPGTKKNEYSSLFEGKNLIFVVAESFSEIGVDKELTPTLYRLMNNGFVFDNFYVPYYLSTIGGEFQSLTGLYPNSNTLKKWRKGENVFPYGIGKVFKEKGYDTYAYHPHNGYFQDRNKYLASLGFVNFKACNMGLDINCDVWPESDVEMVTASVDDYINSDDPFMVYYMTVSGHLEYYFKDNYIASKNRELVKDLSYGEKEKAYLATQIELDRALEIIIKSLEDNGKIDDTVIVLLADHYPYGLTLEEINNLSSYKRDGLFEINHNALIIYNSQMGRVDISKVGMPTDVLPTIYNLFGISFDSRLFAGNDLLSDTEGMVILDNLSWITDRGKYNSITGSFIGEDDYSYIESVNREVQNRIIFSRNMIDYDGYKYIKEG